jgi:hypothetical protein
MMKNNVKAKTIGRMASAVGVSIGLSNFKVIKNSNLEKKV